MIVLWRSIVGSPCLRKLPFGSPILETLHSGAEVKRRLKDFRFLGSGVGISEGRV